MPKLEVTAVRRDPDRGNIVALAKINGQALLRVILRTTGRTRYCAICRSMLVSGQEAFRPALDSERKGVRRALRFCVPCVEAGPDA